jgi:Arc/MetJ family transcription regulator
VPTNLAIDDDLLKLALKIGGLSSKKETVNEALREFISARERRRLRESFGTFDLIAYADVKAARRAKRRR